MDLHQASFKPKPETSLQPKPKTLHPKPRASKKSLVSKVVTMSKTDDTGKDEEAYLGSSALH